MSSTKLLAILFVSLITACSGPKVPDRPKGAISAINGRSGYELEFNFDDFDSDLSTSHPGTKKYLSGLPDLHKHWCMDTPSKEELVRYIKQWKARGIEIQKENERLKRDCR